MENFYYIASSLGSIATFISFLYFYSKDKAKENRISELEKIAKTLEKSLTIKYQPHLWVNGVKSNGNRIDFDLNNKREWCKLIDFVVESGDLTIDEQNKHLPWELEPNFSSDIFSETTRRWVFTINNTTKATADIQYNIIIKYEDRLGNAYSCRIIGQGLNCKLTTPKRL